MESLELFAGAGGLAIGMSQAGFKHCAVLEWNPYACDTIRHNRNRRTPLVAQWPAPLECDARSVNYGGLGAGVVVVSGGPPCQPFSLAGKHQGSLDERDMFPEAIRAVRELRPKAFIFENVKGLLRSSFATYFEYILLQLTYPHVEKKRNERWSDHLARLETKQTSGRKVLAQSYNVVFRLLNAANFGVPQKRERVFIVGFRADLGVEWSFPEETHSQEALLFSQWVSGEYWRRHKVAGAKRPEAAKGKQKHIERLRHQSDDLPGFSKRLPWVTVRDAIGDLPAPEIGNGGFSDHFFIPGARAYPGHTGSPLDEPAKTLKAGDHGVPGGENMLVRADDSVRYFSIREAARLQTFPDTYEFQGSWSQVMRQLGNAVPVKLAEAVASSVARTLAVES